MKKVIYVQCSVCNSQFAREEVKQHHGDAVPHCPYCFEHDMIFFSHVEHVDKEDAK